MLKPGKFRVEKVWAQLTKPCDQLLTKFDVDVGHHVHLHVGQHVHNPKVLRTYGITVPARTYFDSSWQML